jgi:signal transduction histidine kinase
MRGSKVPVEKCSTRILHLEDCEPDAELVQFAVARQMPGAVVVHARNGKEFSRALAEHATGPRFDIVLSDYTLPDTDGLEAIGLVRQVDTELPAIVVTGTLGEERTLQVLRAGATDMVLKSRLEQLVPAIRRAVLEAAQRRQTREMQEALGHQTCRLQVMTHALSAIVEREDWRAAAAALLAHAMNATQSRAGVMAALLPGRELQLLVTQGLEPAELASAPAWHAALGAVIRGEPFVQNEVLPAPLDAIGPVLVATFGRSGAPVGAMVLAGAAHPYTAADVREAEILQDVGGALFDSFRRRTEQDQLQAQFLQAQKLEAVGRLAGGVAHDFNNMLTVISGYTDLLLDELDSDHSMRAMLEPIARTAERAKALTRQLLVFSRKQTPLVRQADLCQLVKDFQKMLNRVLGEDLTLVVETDPSPCPIEADIGQIEQVLMNLVLNARDAMPGGGRVVVSVHPAADEVLLEVADTGTGMTPEVLAHLFEPFFTTKEPGRGTGLGLSTAYAIVERFGGRIAVNSRPGSGTRFTIRLPRCTSAAPPAAAVPAPVRLEGSSSILLVEDDHEVRDMARQILERAGYTVVAQPGPREALSWYETHTPPQLVVTDVVMPDMRAPELVSRLRAIKPDLRVLYMSGYPEAGWGPTTDLSSLTPFVAKPFSPRSLLASVRASLEVPQAHLDAAGES